ncbi:MAG: hypothetical protein MJZ08_01650 [Bacteroidaceae bacterium]|nr:hypothetical protein [Bacteroidaceae bacterium]
MKKFFLFIVIALAAISVNAQKTTYIAKVGFGVGGDEFAGAIANFGFEVNLPISATNWTFSPSLHGTLITDKDGSDGQSAVYMPLAFGYKVSLGNRWIFRPTFGPMVGYAFDEGKSDEYLQGGFIVGPVLGLNFENTHFSVGFQGFYSVTQLKKESSFYYGMETYDINYTGAYLTLGYKF